jgi:hypothetical protein
VKLNHSCVTTISNCSSASPAAIGVAKSSAASGCSALTKDELALYPIAPDLPCIAHVYKECVVSVAAVLAMLVSVAAVLAMLTTAVL